MISNVKRAKLTHYFNVSKRPDEEVVTKEDYLMAAERVIQVLAIPNDSEAAQTLRASYARYWDALADAHNDDDDAVTLEEWIAHFDHLAQDPVQWDAIAGSRGEAIMRLFDSDHDQRISKDEFHTFFNAAGFPESEYALAFEKLDRIGDGHLTLDELRMAGTEFFTSDDPDARGNWLYGDYIKNLQS